MVLDINQIKKLLPHRYPFLLVDRVLEIEPRVSIKAIKNVTTNEEFFNGHFPDMPIMPGVLQVEAMAQTAGIMMGYSADAAELSATHTLFARIDNLRFRKPVVPGDQLVLEAKLISQKGPVVKVEAKGSVDGAVVVEGELMFSVVKKDNIK